MLGLMVELVVNPIEGKVFVPGIALNARKLNLAHNTILNIS